MSNQSRYLSRIQTLGLSHGCIELSLCAPLVASVTTSPPSQNCNAVEEVHAFRVSMCGYVEATWSGVDTKAQELLRCRFGLEFAGTYKKIRHRVHAVAFGCAFSGVFDCSVLVYSRISSDEFGHALMSVSGRVEYRHRSGLKALHNSLRLSCL